MKKGQLNFSDRFLSLLSVCFVTIAGVSCHHNNRIHPPTPPTYAYMVGSFYNSIVTCLVDDGTFDDCSTIAVTGLNIPSGIAISNGYAFITNSGDNSVISCEVGDGNLTSCTTIPNSALNSLLNTPSGIAINNDYAFILNTPSTDTIISCQVTAGSLTGCIDAGVTNTNAPARIAFSNGYAFITNNDSSTSDQVTSCQVTEGSLSACNTISLSGGPALIFEGGSYGIAINNGYAFITGFEEGNVTCVVNGGDLGFCNNTPLDTYVGAFDIGLNDNYVYFTYPEGFLNNGIVGCEVNDGIVSGCFNPLGTNIIPGITAIAFD